VRLARFVVEHELSVGRVETQCAAVENSADVSGEHELLGSRVEQRATGVEQPHPVGDPQRAISCVDITTARACLRARPVTSHACFFTSFAKLSG
jgi:hypothetical protein